MLGIESDQARDLIVDILDKRNGTEDYDQGLLCAVEVVLSAVRQGGYEEGEYMSGLEHKRALGNPGGRSRVVAYVGQAESINARLSSQTHPLRKMLSHGVVVLCAWSVPRPEVDDFERSLIAHTRPMLNVRFDPPSSLPAWRDPDMECESADIPGFTGVYDGVIGGIDALRASHPPYASPHFAKEKPTF